MRRNVQLNLSVNGEAAEVAFAPYKTLLEVLREDLGLTGTKHGCELGECGACAVLVDGEPLLSCLRARRSSATARDGRDRRGAGARAPSSIRCRPRSPTSAPRSAATARPGILMTAKALLERKPSPTRDEIREALSGNLCRCTGYQQIFEAIEEAAKRAARGAE